MPWNRKEAAMMRPLGEFGWTVADRRLPQRGYGSTERLLNDCVEHLERGGFLVAEADPLPSRLTTTVVPRAWTW